MAQNVGLRYCASLNKITHSLRAKNHLEPNEFRVSIINYWGTHLLGLNDYFPHLPELMQVER